MNTRRGNGEGSIYKRKDGRWVGVINVGYEGGKRRRKSFYGDTRRQVADRLAGALRDTKLGLALTEDQITVGQFLDTWLVEVAKPKLRPLTYRSYESIVGEHLKPVFGRTRLAKLRPTAIQRYLNAVGDDGLNPHTVRNIRAVLRTALALAQRWGLISQNPASLVELPRMPSTEIAPLTRTEARQMVSALKGDRLEALYTLTLTLGLRQGEALGLRWSDVDFEASTINVEATLQRYGRSYHLNEPKSRRSRRRLPLPPSLVNRLLRHRTLQLEDRLRAGSAWSTNQWDLVFLTERGRPLSGPTVTRRLQRLLVQAGLPKKRFHDLRHSAASFMLAEGVPMRVITEILGHSDASLTANVYAHVAPELQREATDRVGRLLLEVS